MPGIHHKIPRRQSCRAGLACVPRGDRRPREQRDGDRAQQLRAPEMRARRIELLAPAAKVGHAKRAKLRVERVALFRVERRLIEQWIDQRAQIKPRAANDQRRALLGDRLADPRASRLRPLGRRVTLDGIDNIDAAMRHQPLLALRRLGRADVEAAIDLPRVRAHDGDGMRTREREGERRFSRARWPADDSKRLSSVQSVARSRTRGAARSCCDRARRAPVVSWRRAR